MLHTRNTRVKIATSVYLSSLSLLGDSTPIDAEANPGFVSRIYITRSLQNRLYRGIFDAWCLRYVYVYNVYAGTLAKTRSSWSNFLVHTGWMRSGVMKSPAGWKGGSLEKGGVSPVLSRDGVVLITALVSDVRSVEKR
ncbi:hypothetical protein BDM02DRAFT_2987176 [Thelephora ganbajun]|uniref:Uncharacterized protein n=1 Tax=Thelephora ganbajun TaxID=370292 RepID=A0ACB6ZBF5_THEGA|nr:hypothetical protein BDM02DRAFT_2987176 [Thelephora ganbajun]